MGLEAKSFKRKLALCLLFQMKNKGRKGKERD